MKLPAWLTPRPLRKPARTMHPWDLNAPLLHLSPVDVWTIGDSTQGLFCPGQTGGGKSSGPGYTVNNAMVNAGYGGLVLTAKPDQVNYWTALCRAAGREDDLIVVRPGGPWRFNPIREELERGGEGGGDVDAVVGTFTAIMDLIDRVGSATGSPGKDSEAFWRQATIRMVRMFVGLLILGQGTVTIDDLHKAIISAPRTREEAGSESWKRSFCYRLLDAADSRSRSPEQKRDLSRIADYIFKELPATPLKTRGSILSIFTAMSDCLQSGVMHSLFGRDSTFTPKASEEGKIIVVGMSAKIYGLAGVVANCLTKFAWQRSIERRSGNVGPETRPVFLDIDECQIFCTGADAPYQATCRAAKASSVLLTQNLSNMYMAMGSGPKGKAEADSLLGNLTTRVFCCNGCPLTNSWASSQIGETRQFFINTNQSSAGHAGVDDWFETVTGIGDQSQHSTGMSEQLAPEVSPSVFTTLRTGGPQNGRIVDAIVYQSGRRFNATGRTWLPVTFQQPQQ